MSLLAATGKYGEYVGHVTIAIRFNTKKVAWNECNALSTIS